MILLTLLCLVCVLLVLITLSIRFCHSGRLMAKIPGPKRWPLIGNALDIMVLRPETSFAFLRDIYKTYGRLSQISSLHIRTVNVYDPEDVETLFSTTRFNSKQNPYQFLRPWLCDGLLISNGDKWKQRRKLLTPAFHFNILKSFCSTFNEQTEKLLSSIEKEQDKEQTDILTFISKTTLNIMCETSMGTTIHEGTVSVADKYFKALHDLGEIMVKRITKIWYHIDWMYKLSPDARRERVLLKDLHAFTHKIIQERKAYREKNNFKGYFDIDDVGKKGRLAMLDLLLEIEKEGKIDMDGIREEVDTFMFEGHDTTAMALVFMIMRIANESRVQDQLNDEMMRIFGASQRLPSVDDLHNMKYLECCIKESLRIYPSVPFLGRFIHEDVQLGGYTVPKGTIIHIHVYDLHHRQDLYPDPEEFVPERFLPENTVQRHPYSYIPFSAGPRNCIGQKFAMLEMKTVMSGLLRRFHLEPVTKHQDVAFLGDLVLRSKHPIYVRFRPRGRLEVPN